MTFSRHALADPEELIRQRTFYASAIDQSSGIQRVYQLALAGNYPQLSVAKKIAKNMAASPPSQDSSKALAHYLKHHVLSHISRKMRYDDVFWCCLFYLLDEESVPECSIGGSLHRLVYRVYDDFDPEDVTG